MKLTAKESFNQKFSQSKNDGNKQAQFIGFSKGEVYRGYIIPKIDEIDIEKDTMVADYPFELVVRHSSVKRFLEGREGYEGRVFAPCCNGDEDCPFCNWNSGSRLPVEIFKVIATSINQICYFLDSNSKSIKVAWFPEFWNNKLFSKFNSRLGSFAKRKGVSFLEAFSYRIKVYTNPEGEIDIEFEEEAQFTDENPAFNKVMKYVYDNPISDVANNLKTSASDLNNVFEFVQESTKDMIDYKNEKAKQLIDYEKDISDMKGETPIVASDESTNTKDEEEFDPYSDNNVDEKFLKEAISLTR